MLLWGQKIFNAAQIPGLSAWYDFTNSAYLTLSATAITRALDRSGSGNNTDVQGTGTARPTFTASEINGLSAAVFDGGDFLVLPSGIYGVPNGNNTVFYVSKCTNESIDRYIIAMTGAAERLLCLSSSTAGQQRFANGSGGGAIAATGVTKTSYNIFTNRTSGTTQSISVNNGSAFSNASATNGLATVATIGSYTNGTTNFLIGGIAEILLYNRLLTAAEIIQVNRYLSGKYAITIA